MASEESQFVVEVVDGRCIASGNCVDVAPDLFDQDDDDGLVIVLKSEFNRGEEPAARRAANVCPVVALQIRQV